MCEFFISRKFQQESERSLLFKYFSCTLLMVEKRQLLCSLILGFYNYWLRMWFLNYFLTQGSAVDTKVQAPQYSTLLDYQNIFLKKLLKCQLLGFLYKILFKICKCSWAATRSHKMLYAFSNCGVFFFIGSCIALGTWKPIF